MLPRGLLDGPYHLLVASEWLLLPYGDFLGASTWLLLILGGFWMVAVNSWV